MPLFRASESDLGEIADLVNSAYRGERARQGWTHEADYLDGQRTDLSTLQNDLRAQPGAALYAFRDAAGSELLGSVWLEPTADGKWYLGMLTVRPDLQDRQLGRSILAEAESIAQSFGASAIRMTVVDIRDTLIAWYRRRGYALTGETLPFPYNNELFGVPRRDDLKFVVMEKRL